MSRTGHLGGGHFDGGHLGADHFAPEDAIGNTSTPGAFPRPRRAGGGTLRGAECRLSAGGVTATVGVSATLAGVALSAKAGRLGAEGIQNPTAEELAALLALDAVSGP